VDTLRYDCGNLIDSFNTERMQQMKNEETTIENEWQVLSSMKPFIQDVWRESNFQAPTNVQKQAVPLILEGKDIIAESPTGTGKTVAYLLPILHKINQDKKDIQAVVIAPSHELAMQISQEIEKWTKGSKIVGASFIGGVNIKKQLENLKKKPQIIVGTTGRLLELIKMKKLKMHEVKTIVVDEYDMLVAQEHADNLKNIIKTTLKDRQLLFFSATLSNKTEQIANELMQQPELLRIQREQEPSNVEHIYFLTEHRKKIEMLQRIIRTGDIKALVFIKDLNRLSEVEAKLTYNKLPIAVLSGDSTKVERQNALNKFRSGSISMLLATDVAARGLDIEGLTHVIHFDFPSEADQYIHRSGRTGRMGAKGTVISIVTKQEESYLKKLSRQLDVNISKKDIYGGKIVD